MRLSISIPIVLILVSIAVVATAQVPGNYPALSITAPTPSCDDAPLLWGADGAAATPGTYDVWLYPRVDGIPLEAQVGMTWPADWDVTLAGVCAGVPSFQTFGNAMHIVMRFDVGEPLQEARPALRFQVVAPTPGILDLTADVGPYGYRTNSGWEEGYGTASGIGWITIGDVHCTRHSMSPGSWCSLVGGVDPGSASLPATINLDAGSIFTEAVTVHTHDCWLAPECGDIYSYDPCIQWFSSALPWVSIQPIGEPDDEYEALLTVDTTNIAVGSYTAHIEYGGACGNCGLRCRDIQIFVGAVATEPTTWGRIKAIHR